MKTSKFFIHFIALLIISTVTFGQTQINTNQIRDAAVTQPKLHANALRPISSGALPDDELTFDQVSETFTLPVTADIALTLAASGNVDHSSITIIATGDGSHELTFPATWKMKGDAYDPNSVQEIVLRYNGITVIGEITTFDIVDAILTDIDLASITQAAPTELNLTFNEAVTASTSGWAVTATGGAVNLSGVAGSGTTNIIFTLSRSILHSETVTVSYDPFVGNTLDLAGIELTAVTDFDVDEPDPPDPGPEDDCPGCTITVDDSGGQDHTTITAANTAAVAGDVIGVKAGTYRETIVAKTGVTYRAFTGEDAFISGFEVIANTGWTVHSGNIYKKTITLPVTGFNTSTSRPDGTCTGGQNPNPNTFCAIGNTTIYANQILRDGEMMFEARWPNITSFDQLMKWENFRQLSYNGGFGATGLTDATLPLSSGLTGATLISNGWFPTESRTVTQTGATTLTYGSIWGTTGTGVWPRKAYYLTGKLALLNAEREWHYEGGILYFWQPGGGTPSGVIVHKARNCGFDARGKQNVKIIGLKFIGCDPFWGDATSTGALLDGIEASFMNHYVRHDVQEWQGVGMSKMFGTKLLGANSVIKNSVMHYSANGVWLGPNCTAENNLMHDIGYPGNWCQPLAPWGNDDGQTITRNTIYRTGRSCFDFGWGESRTTAPYTVRSRENIKVTYNHFYDYGMISADLGATYAWGQINLAGLDYSYNWIHGNKSRYVNGEGGSNVGIYFDQASGPGNIHHNVVWDTQASDAYHETVNPYRSATLNPPSPLLNWYNNTFASSVSQETSNSSYRTYISNPLDVQRNNIYWRRIVINWQDGNNGNNTNAVLPGTNPLFVGSGADGLAYRIQTGSPAKNNGIVIAGITGTTVGAPDIGAYEFGGVDWVPGYIAPVSDGTVNDTQFNYSAGWTYANNQTWTQDFKDQDVHYTNTVGSTATYQFTGTRVSVISELCDNHGIALIEILDGVTVIEDELVNLYQNTGGDASNPCPAGVVATVFTSAIMAADTYSVRITFDDDDLAQVPARNSIIVDAVDVTP